MINRLVTALKSLFPVSDSPATNHIPIIPLQYRTISNTTLLVHRTLELYWSGGLPICPSVIADRLRIAHHTASCPSGIMGTVSMHIGGYTIVVSTDSHPEYNERYVTALLLGYCILDFSYTGDLKLTEWHICTSLKPEHIAMRHFANELIMPANLVKAAFKSSKIDSIETMSECFSVTPKIMMDRLSSLGLAKF